MSKPYFQASQEEREFFAQELLENIQKHMPVEEFQEFVSHVVEQGIEAGFTVEFVAAAGQAKVWS